MTAWTLLYNGVEKTLAYWGLSNPQRHLRSMAQDELTFTADGAAVDSTPVFAYQSYVTLYKGRTVSVSGGVSSFSGGTPWFYGLIIQTPSRGSAEAESVSYKAAGPWWFLDNLVFQQVYENVFLGYASGTTTPTFGNKTSSHLFLNQGFNSTPTVENPWLKITTGQQIIEALNWCLGQFTGTSTPPPFQIGTITPAANCPIDEVRDIICAEVIQKMLRWTPDAVTWFDYTTTPPTFHCARRPELTAVSLPVDGSGAVSDISVNPRNDLVMPSVQIFYETSSSVNGVPSLSLITDFWPATLPANALNQFNALRFTVDLQGVTATITTATLQVQSIATGAGVGPDTANWWYSKYPQYNPATPGSNVLSFTLQAGSATRMPKDTTQSDAGYQMELIEGQIASWMTFGSQRITIQAKAQVRYANKTALQIVTLTYDCLSTNAYAGTQANESVSTYAEPVPSGLAQQIYNSVSVLQYEGEITLEEEEVSGSVSVGNVLNLTGSANSAWAAMNALVQEITEELETGKTNVKYGVAKYLTAGELVDLLRVNRFRKVYSNYSMRPAGAAGNGGGEVNIGNNQPEKNSIPGWSPPNPSVCSENQDGTGGSITHSAADGDASIILGATGLPNAVTIKLSDASGYAMSIRQLSVCQDGVPGTIYVLASAFIPGS